MRMRKIVVREENKYVVTVFVKAKITKKLSEIEVFRMYV